MSRRTLFLIDGSSQMYRAYHAFRGRGLSNQEGQTTHAVYVFVTMLRKLIADHHPDYLAASFDVAGPTFRDQLVTDYNYSFTLGLSYGFGSIFSSVVNPRFGG